MSDRHSFTPSQARNSPLPVLRVEEELELLEEEVVVMAEELQEEAVVVHVEDVVEEAVEAGTSPSMSAALWECDRQRALMGSKPSCRETEQNESTYCLLMKQLFIDTNLPNQ